MVDLALATAIASGYVDCLGALSPYKIRLSQVREFEDGWIFTYNSETYVETNAIEHALAGSGGPIFVSREGRARQLGEDVSAEAQLGGEAVGDWVRVGHLGE